MRTSLLTAFALATVATAARAAPVQFARDGHSYTYSATRQADGSVKLVGKVADTGERFAFRVKGHLVSGDMAGRPVSFSITKDAIDRLATELPTVQRTALATEAN